MMNGDTANPLIMLDEIDKMGTDTRYDPYGALYSLLEQHTAKQFIDECIEVPMDLSCINWLATSNTVSGIPDAIISRFIVFDVPVPSQTDLARIIKSIYKDILEQHTGWGHRFDTSLDKTVMKKLVALPPRKIRQILLDACGHSAMRDNDEKQIRLIESDIHCDIGKGKSSIGFMQ